MLVICDSTPLIHLARIGKLHYIKDLFDKIIIPKEVYEEVIKNGKELNKGEIYIIEEFIDNFIIIKEANLKINQFNLDLGELKALSLCQELKIKNILIDEKEGYNSALILGLKPLRTSALMLRLLNKKIINLKDYSESLFSLSQSGYFISAEIYKELIERGKIIASKN